MSHRRVLRQHEIDRLVREIEEHEAAVRKHNYRLVKATVTVAFVAYLLTPPQWKDYVALTGNLLWLWKT